MQNLQHIKQCAWLVNTVSLAGRITFEEIAAAWIETEMSEGVELSRTKFNRIRDEVQFIFGVIIECERKGGYHYYIYNHEEFSCHGCSFESCAKCVLNKKDCDFFYCPTQHKIFGVITYN